MASSAARAQSADAETLFNDGNRLMAEGQLARACEAFAASNRLEPGAGTLIRLGECRERNHQLASAWSAYKDALARVKDPRKRELAIARVTALEPRLSYLTISVSDQNRTHGLTITRNGQPLDAALWNRALPADGGEYIIAGQAPDCEAWQVTARVAIERASVRVEVPRLQRTLSLASATPVPRATPAASPPVTVPDDNATPAHERFTARRKIALGVAGSSVISAIAAGFLGSSASARQSDAFRLCPDPTVPCPQAGQANALIASSHHRALGANIAFGAAAAAAIAAGVLWFTGAPAENATRVGVVPALVPSQPGIVVLGSF